MSKAKVPLAATEPSGAPAGRAGHASAPAAQRAAAKPANAPARRAGGIPAPDAQVLAGGRTLRVTEIFHSLQGETRTVGLPTVFVRLTGCPLRCRYCDTAYAFHGGEQRSLEAIVAAVDDFAPRYVTVTGGEPLAQPNCLPLLSLLCDRGYEVSLETSGALNTAAVDPRVVKVIDLKTPASGEMARNDYSTMDTLQPRDQVQFVICDRADYEWARFKLDQHRLPGRVSDILFSPSFNQQDPAELADWVLADRLPVRVQLQLHKLLWGDQPGR